MTEKTSFAPILPADPNEFRAWLSAMDANSIAGRAQNDCGCPLAAWLNSLNESAPYTLRVGDDCLFNVNAHTWSFSAPWYADFVRCVDNDFARGEVVTAKDALAMLNIVAGAAL